ncbi:hypothetical protein NUM_04350 [Actinocatenispora comari]|uniref:Uncharacterized protein n=2 Tax=Actinocatenispora comari TaxID=2807577 RepID=A0A8J4EIP8_9ACTN|nr:hypothetical protein NUM_04350 [Actinocatenispora comari]
MRQDIDETHAGRLPKGPTRPLLLPPMSDTPDRNDESPHTAPIATREVAGRGHLFDTTLYQAWAIDADGGWLYLPADASPDAAADAAGQSWRALTKAGALHCPYPGCGAAFSGVRKGAGRVAFVHPKTETTHTDKQAKQAMWRLAGRQAVAGWARQAYPGASVEAADRDSTPDVLVTTADGARIAVHLLSDKVSDADWRAQADADREAGVTAVWLVAHTGAFARKATGTDLYRPAAPVPAALAAGATIGWLNPFLGLVGRADADGDVTALALTELPLDAWRLDAVAAPVDAATTATEPAAAAAAQPAGDPQQTETGSATAAPAKAEPAKPEPAEPEPAEAESAEATPVKAESAEAESATTESAEGESAAGESVAAKDADVTAGTDQPAAVAAESDEPAEVTAAEPADGKDADLTAGTDQPATASAPTAADAAGARPAARPAGGTRPPAAPRSGGWLRRMLDRLRRPAA